MFFRSKFSSNLWWTPRVFFLYSCRIMSSIFSRSGWREFVCFFAKFERKVSLSWRYFCISRVISRNSVSETRLSFRAWETELLIESCLAMAREWSHWVFINFAVKLLVENGQAHKSCASGSRNPATRAPTTIPTPVREAAIAPEDRAAVTAPRPTAK